MVNMLKNILKKIIIKASHNNSNFFLKFNLMLKKCKNNIERNLNFCVKIIILYVQVHAQ
jgi:hypothetical protein